MHNIIPITEDLFYVGGSDRRLSLFENVYPVPRGVSYNSYLLLDEKTVLFDTVDPAVSDLYLENVAAALGGRQLDYLVVHHMEPDHSATFLRLVKSYPHATVVTSAKAAQMMRNFFPFDGANVRTVKEGDILSTGKHNFIFLAAPMVHWPEVMLSFDRATGTLFSADAFGTFGALGGSVFADEVKFREEFLPDARRYYFNIVGKYGVQVQNVLKKAAGLDIKMICPLHGPVWRKDLGELIGWYDTWSKYEPEEKGAVVFYGTVHGHTGNAADILAAAIARRGAFVKEYDVAQTELSVLVAEAFRYSHLVFVSATYNNGIFFPMEQLLHDLGEHNLRNRKYALVENGSWSPQAGTLMQDLISEWGNMMRLGEKVTVLSSVKEEQAAELEVLGAQIASDLLGK